MYQFDAFKLQADILKMYTVIDIIFLFHEESRKVFWNKNAFQ